MNFWRLAFQWGWASIEQLKTVTKFGEISADEFKEITGSEYIVDIRKTL